MSSKPALFSSSSGRNMAAILTIAFLASVFGLTACGKRILI
jgi:hypothetical protein